MISAWTELNYFKFASGLYKHIHMIRQNCLQKCNTQGVIFFLVSDNNARVGTVHVDQTLFRHFR